jgi:tetratricopeptide (TPR) repeat protein
VTIVGFKFHVFLSHSARDKAAVEELALRLKQEGIEPWLDKWNLVPGEPWQPAIERALDDCAACAVVIGAGGMGVWQNEEMRAAIDRRVRVVQGQFRVIPVLLPGVDRPERGKLPAFLLATTWVEFRSVIDDAEAIRRLICGIQGKEPGAGPGGAAFEGTAPYRGLEVFDVEHAPFFFGRESLTEWLVNALRPKASGEESRFLAVLGASGSGKSSLARAGLEAALRKGALEGSGDWPVVVLKPGRDPLESLSVALAGLPGGASLVKDTRDLLAITAFGDDPKSLHTFARLALGDTLRTRRLVVLVDQMEEVFTLCEDGAARRAFLENLLYAATVLDGRSIVVLTMRADFYARCASYPALAAAMSDHQLLVGPMTEDELGRAIERPALLAGGEFEPGLIGMLLQDVEGQIGALPLLEFTLMELWQRREGRRMTVAAYKSIGGLRGAINNRADDVLGQFDEVRRDLCRRLFLRLTQPGEGIEDTRRRASFDELVPAGADPSAVAAVVRRLADARLITIKGNSQVAGEVSVEVAHEALIRGWGQLREWIDADRAGLRLQRQLTEAAREWQAHGRESSFLYAGTRLTAAREWSKTHRDRLNRAEAEFLTASVRRRRRGRIAWVGSILVILGTALGLGASARQRLAQKRAVGQQSIFQAQEALSKGDWQGAKQQLVSALGVIDRYSALAHERSQAGRLLSEVQRKLDEQKARRDAQDRLAQFDRSRGEILFRATQSLDADSPALRNAAEQSAREAFAAVGLAFEAPARLVLDPAFNAAEREAIASGGYELLIVLADAQARPLSAQSPTDHRVRAAQTLQLLDRAAGLRPPTRAWHLGRARCLAVLGEAAAARQERTAAATLPATGALDAFLAGVDLFMGGERSPDRSGLAEAIDCFQEALRRQPDHFWARYYLAVCALNTGRPDLAESHLTACFTQRPDFVWLPLLRGFALAELRKFEAAEADFRRAAELAQDDDDRYALLVNRGAFWSAQGTTEKAAADFEQAVALRPDRFRAFGNLALLRKRESRHAEALGHLDQAIALGPPELVLADLRVERASLLLLLGRRDDALRVCDDLLRIDPDTANALAIRAQALLEQRDYAASARDFTRALNLKPGDTATGNLFRGRGQARMRLGDYLGAVDDYTQALVLQPDQGIWAHRGWAYFFAESHRLALRDFEESLRLGPMGVEARIGRGLARVALGQDREAVVDAQHALERPPGDPEMLLNIACIFGRAAGRQDPAGQHCSKAVSALRLALERLRPDARRPFWRDKVLPDSYLEPIRRCPAFLDLARQVEAEPRASQPEGPPQNY